MSLNHPKTGLNHVGAYQVAGIPFVTSSLIGEVPGPDDDSVSQPVSVKFPFVTNIMTVRIIGINDLRVGFSLDGVIAPTEKLATEDSIKNADQHRNYFLLPCTGSAAHGEPAGLHNSVATFNIRCKEIVFLSDVPASTDGTTAARSTGFSILAGLTTIDSSQFPALTGSNGFDGV